MSVASLHSNLKRRNHLEHDTVNLSFGVLSVLACGREIEGLVM